MKVESPPPRLANWLDARTTWKPERVRYRAMFRRFIEDLLAGDPVALTVAGVLAAGALIMCLIWWRTARALRKEDEQRRNRFKGRK